MRIQPNPLELFLGKNGPQRRHPRGPSEFYFTTATAQTLGGWQAARHSKKGYIHACAVRNWQTFPLVKSQPTATLAERGSFHELRPAADRWALLLVLLERQFDVDRDALDHAVGSIVEIPPERVALFAQLRGGRQ